MQYRLATSLATSALIAATPGLAQDFGDYGYDTIRDLVFDYPGRYTGSTVFPRATDYMEERLSFDGAVTSRQTFGTESGPSQNVLATMPGRTDRFIVVGAHFDTAGTFPDLQGVDDNASGAALLTELAGHMAGLETETGLVFNAFGAEEIGLVGSRHYVDTLTDAQRRNIAGMINIDSLITGDHMYAHAGTNYLANPALKSLWRQVHAIADEAGIDLRSNPGLNPHYPIDTGCCSDGASFEGLDIPVLWLESTNWELGDLDGYTQTDNPAIPGGATWHNPDLDRWDVLTGAFGEDRIPGRLHDYALIMTRLLVQATGADLIASARSAAATGGALTNLAARQQDDLTRQGIAAARARLDAPGEVGRFTPNVTVQGLARPGDTGDLGTEGGSRISAEIGGFWQVDPTLSIGGRLAYQHDGDDLEDGGDVSARGGAIGLDMAMRRDAAWAVAEISYAKSSLEANRRFTLISGLGAEILSRDFDSDSKAYTLGAAVVGGYDFGTGSLRYGPVVGLDYARTRIGSASEGSDRLAVRYEGQDFESLELQLGGQVSQTLAVQGRDVTLSGYALWVRELADGQPETITVTDSTGTVRRIGIAGADDSFGRIGVWAQMQLSPAAFGWLSLDGRVGHDAGAETALGAGVAMRF